LYFITAVSLKVRRVKNATALPEYLTSFQSYLSRAAPESSSPRRGMSAGSSIRSSSSSSYYWSIGFISFGQQGGLLRRGGPRTRCFYDRHNSRPNGFRQRLPALDDQRQIGLFSGQQRQAGRQVALTYCESVGIDKKLWRIRNGLENRCGRKSTEGSNPSLSA
jgi:hypothetical protein